MPHNYFSTTTEYMFKYFDRPLKATYKNTGWIVRIFLEGE